MNRLTASMVAKTLNEDCLAAEKWKFDETIPMENPAIPRTEHEEYLAKITETSHLRDHWPYFNQEQRNMIISALNGRFEDLDVVDRRTTSFGNTTIDQYKFRLKTPVWSRRVHLPVEFEDQAILHRRHAKTPGVDFIVPLTDEVKKHMTKIDTQILTIRRGDPPTPGTGFAGTHFPGMTDSDDFSGILYKWYKTDDERAADIAAFDNGIKKHIPALIDARDYQALVLNE